MPEKQAEGPREGEEKFIVNSDRAEAMAYKTDGTEVLARNADKTGMPDLAIELRQKASEIGNAAGVEFDENDKRINNWVADMGRKTADFMTDDTQEVLSMLQDDSTQPILELAINKLYGLVGAELPTVSQRELSSVHNEAFSTETQLGVWMTERRSHDASGKPTVTLYAGKKGPITEGN